MKSAKAQPVFPVLPLRDVVVYPNMVIPLFVGREKSMRALERAMLHDVPMVPLGWLAPVSLAHAFVVRPEVVGFADDGGVVTGDDALVALGRAALR